MELTSSPIWSQIRFPAINRKKATVCDTVAGPLSGDSTDELLFARVCSFGEHAAFGILVDRYRARIIGLARRMLLGVQSGDAEDIAQETFVEVFRKRDGFKRGEPFRPWLYRIAVNRCIDRIRASERRPTSELIDSDTGFRKPTNNPLAQLLADERMREVDSAIALLPPKHRAVLILRYLDDMSYEEIAAATQLPVGTVKTHLFRARAELRRKLEDDNAEL